MTNSGLVKIGVSPERAEGVRFRRSLQQMIDQHEAQIARLEAAFRQRIREFAADEPKAEEPVVATA